MEWVRVPLYTPDVGASTACLVCWGLLLMGEHGRLKKILLIGTFAVLIGLVFQHSVYNIDHFMGYLIGIATGGVFAWIGKQKIKNKHRQP